ncbi:ATP-binding protein [Caenispirillum bisanense]|uniref:ATP-binding protein n=1 Tax=Caenispirillum bisanense TaxID=414052 RepID=UPI0031DFB5D5
MFRPRAPVLLLGLALIIALIETVMLMARHEMARRSLDDALAEQGRHLHDSFVLMLDQLEQTMLSTATLVAGDPEVQQLFLAGARAVAAEGGGAGGAEAALWRDRLMDRVSPAWTEVQERFNVRQLHFHLAPGSTSFLRVHQPDRFGDDLAAVRHSVVAANATGTPQAGFETGRVYSGLRGVVPVTATDPLTGASVHVGALEAGTALDTVVNTLDRRLNHGVAVLLGKEHVEKSMFADLAAPVLQTAGRCGCVVEAVSRDGLADVLGRALDAGVALKTPGTQLLEYEGGAVALSHFPLRDFRGTRDASLAPVGAVVFWNDATPLVAAFRADRLKEVVFGVVAYAVVMLSVLAAFHFGARRFDSLLAAKTRELAAANALLHDQSANLERSNRELEQFAHIVSHDLREPLRSVVSFLMLVKRRAGAAALDEDTRRFIDYAISGGERMSRMVSDLLDLSRVRTRGSEFRPEASADLVAEAVRNLTIAIQDAHAEVVVTEGAPPVLGDRGQLVRLFQNLIGNALSYRRQGLPPVVRVDWMEQGPLVRFSIIDNGIGIPPEFSEAVFLPFRRLNPGGGAEGSGIGLAICRSIVERHGGSIVAEPAPDGAGACLTFTLVRATLPEAAAGGAPAAVAAGGRGDAATDPADGIGRAEQAA